MAVAAGSGMQLEVVRRIVRDVAADIVGEEALEGERILPKVLNRHCFHRTSLP